MILEDQEKKPSITLRRAAMNYLARREHSFHELIQKLSAKYPQFDKDELISPAVQRLAEENLQSDQRYLESYIRFRRLKGFGPLKIDAELFHKGVDAELIKAELYSEENDWQAMCQNALEKKFSVRDSSTVPEQQRYQRFLVQRGFTVEQIRETLR